MDCPKCKEKLRHEQYRENDYMLCFYCEGAWLEAEEIDKRLIKHALRISEVVTKYHCPKCVDKLMNKATVGDMELEYCQSCGGLFFDKGELESAYPDYKDLDGSRIASDTVTAVTTLVMISRVFRVINGLFKR